ncbi:hypothetical protein ABV23_RS00630 [Escherichia coli]|nr:hypothetical protein [Escherichia coli]
MLPFVRMFEYGNVAPIQPKIIQMECLNGGVYLLYDNGELYYRGRNSNGLAGDGTNTSKSSSWILSNTNVAMLSKGVSNYAVVRKKDNTFWMTGSYNLFDVSGWTKYRWNDVTSNFSEVSSNLICVYCNGGGVLTLRSDGTLYAFGTSTSGQLGFGSATTINTFTKVAESVSTNPDNVIAVLGGCYYIDENNRLFATGVNTNGQLGIGSTVNALSFTLVNTGTTYPVVKSIMANANGANILAYKSDDSAYVTAASGYLSYIGTGQTSGIGTIFSNYAALNNPDNFNILKLSTSLGNTNAMLVVTDKGVYATGMNNYYQLGTDNSTNQTSYVKVVGLPDDADTTTIRFLGGTAEGSACVYRDKLYVSGVLGQWGAGYPKFTELEIPY